MGTLNRLLIERAFGELGQELRTEASILVVGGAAGVLTKQLPDIWTTSDVDAVEFRPPQEIEEVLRAAAVITRRLGLPANWLNSEAGLFLHDMPEHWEDRRVFIGDFARLRVWAISRLDLIATKFYAHRPIDRLHLVAMKVSASELAFVKSYLDTKGDDKAAKARVYVDAWETPS